jgi:hypothetical protein
MNTLPFVLNKSALPLATQACQNITDVTKWLLPFKWLTDTRNSHRESSFSSLVYQMKYICNDSLVQAMLFYHEWGLHFALSSPFSQATFLLISHLRPCICSFKSKKESNTVLHLEHSTVWCWNLDTSESFKMWCWRRMEINCEKLRSITESKRRGISHMK